MKLEVAVYRSGKKSQQYDKYEVPYKKGMTVLDLIFYIQKHLDPTLAYRYECRQGICGTCGVMYNGKPVLSCSTQVDPKSQGQRIDPLDNYPVEKDLIVNLKPILDRFQEIKPYLDKINEVRIGKKIANESKQFRKCIECGCCIAGSTTIRAKDGIYDPMDLVKIARYLTDPRDGVLRKTAAVKESVNSYSDEELKYLSDICPRGVPIDKAIKIIREK